jgi:hypothetical protein
LPFYHGIFSALFSFSTVRHTVIRTNELMGRFYDSRVINMFYNEFLS